jgi:hypothetical protein
VTAQPLPNAVTAFVETVNAGDTLGFLDSFTPDAVVDDWGRRFTDREAIRACGRMTVTKSSVDGRTAVVIADWRSTHANGLSRFVFTLAGDKIAQMQISAA